MVTKILAKKPAPKASARPVAAEKPKRVTKAEQVIRDRSEKGLSLKGLLRSTPPYVKMKSRDEVVIKKYTPGGRTKGGHPAITAICISNTHRAPVRHKLSIIGLDTDVKAVSRQKSVLVSCDCEDFMYTWEYALSTWGAARIKYCNGEPAVVKNPGNYPGMCKHLVAVAKLAVERAD